MRFRSVFIWREGGETLPAVKTPIVQLAQRLPFGKCLLQGPRANGPGSNVSRAEGPAGGSRPAVLPWAGVGTRTSDDLDCEERPAMAAVDEIPTHTPDVPAEPPPP